MRTLLFHKKHLEGRLYHEPFLESNYPSTEPGHFAGHAQPVAMPSLEELELDQVLQPSAHHPSSRRISFPKLRHLRLVEVDDDPVAATFLDMIILPSTTRLSLEGRIPSADYELPLLDAIDRYFTGSTTGAKSPREVLACRMTSEGIPFQSFLFVDVWTTQVPLRNLH